MYEPVAVNWVVAPKAAVGFAGVTVIDTRAAGVTVNVVDPLIGPEVAVIVVCPVEALLARPVLVTTATLGLVDTQVAVLLMS